MFYVVETLKLEVQFHILDAWTDHKLRTSFRDKVRKQTGLCGFKKKKKDYRNRHIISLQHQVAEFYTES